MLALGTGHAAATGRRSASASASDGAGAGQFLELLKGWMSELATDASETI